MKKLKNIFNAFVLVLALSKLGQFVLGWKYVSNSLDESASYMYITKKIKSDEGVKMFEQIPLYIHLMIGFILPLIIVVFLFLQVFKKYYENMLEESLDKSFDLNFIWLKFICYIIGLSVVWIAPKIIKVNGSFGHTTKLATTLVKVFYKSLFVRVRKVVCEFLLKSYIFKYLLIFILFGNAFAGIKYYTFKKRKQRIPIVYPLFLF